MKALIVYSSWFGHNRAIASLLASELRQHGMSVDILPDARVAPGRVASYDLLILGSYTHNGRAGHRLRALIEQIAPRQLQRLSVAVFGTQVVESPSYHHPGGVDDLEACLAARGCDLAVAPLRIGSNGLGRFTSRLGLSASERATIRAFAAELWDASVPALLI